MNDFKTLVSISVNLEQIGELSYLLINDKGTDGKDCYSMIVKYSCNETEQTAVLEDITRDKEEATDFVYLFAKETVTPDTASIIMEDLLSALIE